MVRLEPHHEGVVLPVRARAGARQSGVRGEQDGMLKVSTTQIAERGKANRTLTRILAKSLALRGSQIELLSGQTSARKRFLIREITLDELARRIAAVIGRQS